MDVQTENMDPPPCESQSSGKIRKGFKLFGKRKPGNIFSIRSKGDGNNKSPVIRSTTIDGLSETAAQDLEQELDREKGQEVSQGEREHAEEEPLGEDGTLAAAPARASISSASSAKSLSFLSLLRGGRRGVGDRRVHTVSQPVGRHRRGLKGLFDNVRFRSKDKEKEEAPPSPLLMSSRANSVEIIKEDLTLTPKCQPRSLDSPETESCDPEKSLTTQDSAATSPSEPITPQVTAGNVSRTNEHVLPLPTSEPPLVPGDNSLSCLLADISSLLTFDSISGGGDIMADVEAEWGKASSPIGSVVTEVMPSSTSLFSKPTISTPLTSASVSNAAMAKSSSVAVPTTASTQSFTPLTKTPSTSSPIAKPSSIITTLTKSSTLTTHSVKLSSDSTPASEPSASIKLKLTLTPIATKPSTTPISLTGLSAPIMSPPSMTIKSALSSTSTTTAAPPNTPATVVKAPSVSPTITCKASKLASEIAAPLQMIASVSKPISVTTPTPVSAKPPPVTHSPPTPVAFTQPSPAKLDSASSLNLQTSTSYKLSLSSAAGESKAPVIVSTACAVTTKPSSPAPVIPSKMTMVPTLTTTSGSVSAALYIPTLTSSPMDLNKTPPSLASVPDIYPYSPPTPRTRTQPSAAASLPTPSSTSLDKIPPTTKSTPAPVSLDKTPPAPPSTPTPTTHAVVSTASTTPPPPGQIQVSQSKAPPVPAQIPISVPKDPLSPAQMQVSQSKAPLAPAQIPISVSKPPPIPAQIPISVSKPPPVPAHIPISVSKPPPVPAQIPISVSKPLLSLLRSQFLYQNPLLSLLRSQVLYQSPLLFLLRSQFLYQNPLLSLLKSQVLCLKIRLLLFKFKFPNLKPRLPLLVSQFLHLLTFLPLFISQILYLKPLLHQPLALALSLLFLLPLHLVRVRPQPAKMRGSGQASVDGQLTSPSSTSAQGAQTVPSKTEELQNESQKSLQGPSRERRIPQAKASGLSKIPVVGGGRAGKLPVRDSQHVDDEGCRDPPTPMHEEERPHFNSHDAGSKDKISDVEANVPTSKHTKEESQQLPQPKVLTSSPRDSKIPVKHGVQSHTASQIPQAKEPSRTKIPVSKVPVRRADCNSWRHYTISNSNRVEEADSTQAQNISTGSRTTSLALWC
ncbi:LOW QUALITY PROTEIN: APC membrane recruitment protein 2 [Perca fluviatilis]|uniref:LOW QUALITY PROTEIN: APC membrane recruitment protein 2 n=1 Tax=Perca fluviatilis TaxID=8168 RepID=UPI0019631C6E|nr:LOW QUALITY PROTEIN: APC membrane recruitment protein 2 [Perca fluviatilis]